MSATRKAAGAALAVAAPEAKAAEAAAGKTAGKAAAGKTATARRRKPTTSTTAGSPAPPPPRAGLPTAPAALTDQRGAPGWYQKARTPVTDPVALGNAGGGFLLGLGLWALGLAYLRGGPAGVKQLLAAKFLNRTPGSTTTPSGAATAPQRVGSLPLNTSPTVAVPRPGLSVAQ